MARCRSGDGGPPPGRAGGVPPPTGTLRPAPRAGGGIGRRARFRSVCPQGHGGSSPPSPTHSRPRSRGGRADHRETCTGAAKRPKTVAGGSVWVDGPTEAEVAAALAGLDAPRVVIDDGSHRGEDIWATFRQLFPHMPPGSVYIVEDLSTSYWPEYGGDVPAPATSAVRLAHELIDSVQGSAAVHLWFGGASSQRPMPVSEFSAVAAVHVVPNALIIERA